MIRTVWVLLVFALLAESALAGLCAPSVSNQASPLVVAMHKRQGQQLRSEDHYATSYSGTALGEIALVAGFSRFQMPELEARRAGKQYAQDSGPLSIIVADERFAWKSDFAIKAGREEMVCLLRSGDGVLLSLPRNDHISVIWSVDYAREIVSLFEEIPYDSPLLLTRNAGRYHGTVVKDKRTGAMLIEVPLGEVKNGLVAILADVQPPGGWQRLLPDGLSPEQLRARKSVLFANAAIQCPVYCLPESIGPSEMSANNNLELFASDCFAASAMWLRFNRSGPRMRLHIPQCSEAAMSLWPENSTLLLVRLALAADELDFADHVLNLAIRRGIRKHVTLFALLKAYTATLRGGSDASSLSVIALRSAQNDVQTLCGERIYEDPQRHGRTVLVQPKYLFQDGCWLVISALRDAEKLNILHAVDSGTTLPDNAVDRWRNVVLDSSITSLGLALTYTNQRRFSEAISVAGLNEAPLTVFQKRQRAALGAYTVLPLDRVLASVRDERSSFPVASYMAMPALLSARMLWQCTENGSSFTDFIANLGDWSEDDIVNDPCFR